MSADAAFEAYAAKHDGTDDADCPTCSGPVRETVGMVCQTCGTDYARDDADYASTQGEEGWRLPPGLDRNDDPFDESYRQWRTLRLLDAERSPVMHESTRLMRLGQAQSLDEQIVGAAMEFREVELAGVYGSPAWVAARERLADLCDRRAGL